MRPIMRRSTCIALQSRLKTRMATLSALSPYAVLLDMAVSVPRETQGNASFYSNLSTLVSIGAPAIVAAFSFVLKTSVSEELKNTEEKLSREIKDQSTILVTLAAPTILIALLVVVFTFIMSLVR